MPPKTINPNDLFYFDFHPTGNKFDNDFIDWYKELSETPKYERFKNALEKPVKNCSQNDFISKSSLIQNTLLSCWNAVKFDREGTQDFSTKTNGNKETIGYLEDARKAASTLSRIKNHPKLSITLAKTIIDIRDSGLFITFKKEGVDKTNILDSFYTLFSRLEENLKSVDSTRLDNRSIYGCLSFKTNPAKRKRPDTASMLAFELSHQFRYSSSPVKHRPQRDEPYFSMRYCPESKNLVKKPRSQAGKPCWESVAELVTIFLKESYGKDEAKKAVSSLVKQNASYYYWSYR